VHKRARQVTSRKIKSSQGRSSHLKEDQTKRKQKQSYSSYKKADSDVKKVTVYSFSDVGHAATQAGSHDHASAG